MSIINLNKGDNLSATLQNGRIGAPVDARQSVLYYKDIFDSTKYKYPYAYCQVIVREDDPEDTEHPKGIYVITEVDRLGNVVSSGVIPLNLLIGGKLEDITIATTKNQSSVELGRINSEDSTFRIEAGSGIKVDNWPNDSEPKNAVKIGIDTNVIATKEDTLLKTTQSLTNTEKETVIGNILDKDYIAESYVGKGKKYLKLNVDAPVAKNFDGFINNAITEQSSLAEVPENIYFDRTNNRFIASKGEGLLLKYYMSWLNGEAYMNPNSGAYFKNSDNYYQWNGTTLEAATISINKLTQADFDTESTIYVIRYDYDLNNQTITIPENCVLEFDGGSLNNGIIVLQNTRLEGEVSFDNVQISGSCSNEILTPQMFGAVATISENNNDDNITKTTVGFENLARIVNNTNNCNKVIYIPSGHYAINKIIHFDQNCKIYGDGDLTVLDLYDGGGSLCFCYDDVENDYFSKTCDFLQNATLTSDANIGDRTISINNTSNINKDDYLIILDTVDGSFNKDRSYYRSGEVVKVKSVNSETNVVTLYNSLSGVYPIDFGNDSSSIEDAPNYRIAISKFNPRTFQLSDFKIVGHDHNKESDEMAYFAIVVCGFINSKFENINVSSEGHSVPALFVLGVNFNIEKCTFRNKTENSKYTSDSYGVSFANCQRYRVVGCTIEAESHAIATGGASSKYSIVNRNFSYENIYIDQTRSKNYGDIDVHGNAELYKYINIDAPYASCDTGGYNMIVEGCRFKHISTGFNCGGVIIRNCTIVDPELNLTWTNWGNPAHMTKTIIVENCIIYGSAPLQFDFLAAAIPFENFIWRNNTCNGLWLRNGSVNTIVIDNNIFVRREFESLVVCKEFTFTNNIFKNGYAFFSSSNVAKGNIVNNTIMYDGIFSTGPDHYCLYIGGFDGNISDNNIFCEKDTSLIEVFRNSFVNINNNLLRGGSGKDRLMTRSVVVVTENSHVLFNNNTHNSSYGNAIQIVDNTNSYAKMDWYDNYFNKAVEQINPIDAIGQNVYFRDINKLGYVSNIPKAGMILQVIVNDVNTPTIVNNTLESNKIYFLNFGYAGHQELYFSKTNSINDESLLVVDIWNTTNTIFLAPDSSVYPYICCKTSREGGIGFSFYENRVLSEYDGAVYNVNRSGESNQRPSGYDIYIGFRYFDTTLRKPLYAINIESDGRVTWAEEDGVIVSVGDNNTWVKRIGESLDRPTIGYYIYKGFVYYDTTLKKPVFADSIGVPSDNYTITWIDLDGNNPYQ